MSDKNADRTSIEIKTLLRKLNPEKGGHKDRVRRINRFRGYLMETKGKVPEFYDDDIPLLLLGNAAPKQFVDPDDESLIGLYGVMQACGTPSTDNASRLKRSARNAMSLLKWMLMDWKEPNQKKGQLNIFAQSFLSLPVQHYQHMNLDLHCAGDDRGGNKDEACRIIGLILTKHLADDGERESPVALEELMSGKGQQEFELWSVKNLANKAQTIIAQNAQIRQTEIAAEQRKEVIHRTTAGLGEDIEDDDVLDEAEDEDSDADDDGDNFMSSMRKKKKKASKELKEAEERGEIVVPAGVATRWEDSQLAREQAARAATAAQAGQHGTVRDTLEAMHEAAEREEEKAKVFIKDPLGIVKEEGFELRTIEKLQAEQMERALNELQEELQKAESTGKNDLVRKVMAQKESLEGLIDRLGGVEALEDATNHPKSVLPTSPKFDPILFLTLVHRTSTYDKLVGSLDRLMSKTENQVEQLENLVRDNFPLFVRCAEGFEEFKNSAENEVGMGLHERIDKLEAIAESCAFQAKKSFKPLLDNTSEVRKVQSSMSVLQRVAPILQVPALMRQHIENRRYSQALKAYRRVLVIDRETCRIELLLHVKTQAEVCLRDARKELERRVAMAGVSVDNLLDAIRDLGELLELEVPEPTSLDEDEEKRESGIDRGLYDVGGTIINVREHSPALSCLLLQAAHFAYRVENLISDADESCSRIFAGESLLDIRSSQDGPTEGAERTKTKGNQWKYDVLDARVLSTIKAVSLARTWLPRLIRVGRAAAETEKHKALRVAVSRKPSESRSRELSAFEVFLQSVTPSLYRLMEHASFCAIGSNTRAGSKDVAMTFGQDSDDQLHSLLRSPLPPSQSTKVGKELAELVDVVSSNAASAVTLRIDVDPSMGAFQKSPLDESKALGDTAVITIEKRRCIYAFDVCARACSNRASGSGKFDADALVNCLQNLAENLTRPDQCSNEVEKGCELVVRRSCEGLASYVRDRGDAARLNAVAECADAVSSRVVDIVREAAFLTDKGDLIQEVISEDILGLESAMFDEFLENIRTEVAESVRLAWLDTDPNESNKESPFEEGSDASAFPSYLSASLLAIVRCRAQVEQSLGDRVRQSEGRLYQHIAMSTVADGVVEGICQEIERRKIKLKVRQADRLANELEFLRNTLKKFMSENMKGLLNSSLHMVSGKAGRRAGDGPEGLAALEELERLGRVYVLCLGE